jgi:hypothetical protein
VRPSIPPYLVHCVICNVFKPFIGFPRSELAAISLRAQFPNSSVNQGLARYKTASPNRECVCPRGLRNSADPPARDRIGEHPPSNQSLPSASRDLCRNLPGKRNSPRGSWIGHLRLQSSLPTHRPWSQNHPLKPPSLWFQKPAPIEHFYKFLRRAGFCFQSVRSLPSRQLEHHC